MLNNLASGFVHSWQFELQIATVIVAFDITVDIPKSRICAAVSAVIAAAPIELVVDGQLLSILWLDKHVLWRRPSFDLPWLGLGRLPTAFALW